MKMRIHPAALAALIIALVAWPSGAPRAEPSQLVPSGFRPVPPGVHALVGGKVVPRPGETLDSATVILRDGLIQAVGRDVAIPADARVWDMTGLTIYAGFIDPMLSLGSSEADKPARKPSDERTSGGVRFFGVGESPAAGPGYELPSITPERRMVENLAPDPKELEKLRELGFTTGNAVPEKGILRGTSAFIALSEAEPNQAVIKADVFQHVAFERRSGGYPGSLMGVISATRQSFFDAQHYALDQADYQKHPRDRARPAYNLALEALAPALARKMTVVFEPRDALMVDRASRVAKEIGLDYYILASGQEWRRPELAKASAVPFIVPLNFPEIPKLPQDDDWAQVSLDELRAWDWAPENPAVLRAQGLEISLTTHGLSDKGDFRKNLRRAIDRGLSEYDALAALTTVPARLCGVDNLAGAIQPGKLANLTIVDGKGYFDPESKVRSVWIDGRFFRATPEKEETKTKEKKPDTASDTKPAADKKTEAKPADPKADEEKKKAEKEKKIAKEKELQKRVAQSPLAGRGPIADFPRVILRNATIWTCGPQGILSNTDLLIVNGKIAKIGKDLLQDKSLVGETVYDVDGTGLHATPGLIDCHSHSMILDGVNEGTLPSSAMVRIGDVVNSETPNIYEQLAGGVTAVNLLHGSANPIGGQNCVIKLRDGAPPESLKFVNAPPGIKFALGENVKQSNWGPRDVTRYPQTRMGVQTFIENRFIAARHYLEDWAAFQQNGGVAPRRDLELEAIGEILRGERWIHCHSYRQDEILMLIRLMDGFGVKIATFQHVLEGYKVADEIAKHGAGGSTFSDWWAYKFEVYDAIPHNGSLMRDRGVVVSFNSDSDDLARRLYLEAAKAVKYGGSSEEEALKFVTLNPAKQLRVDKFVGSLDPGKDADFALWSRSPLDSATVCLQTWIDGKLYFDKSLAQARAESIAQERNALVAKAKKIASPGDSPDDAKVAVKTASLFEQSLEHMYDGVDRHCLDNNEE